MSITYQDHVNPAQIELIMQQNSSIFIGTFHNDFSEQYVSTFRPGKLKLIIPDVIHQNRAIHEDIVAVQMSIVDSADEYRSEKSKIRIGTIISIIQRKHQIIPGVLRFNSRQKTLRQFNPASQTLPFVDIITTHSISLDDIYCLISINEWSTTSKHPSGILVKEFGLTTSKQATEEFIIHSHHLIQEHFSVEVMKEVKQCETIEQIIRQNLEDKIIRKDYRSYCIFSIDPDDCEDIDDALHIKEIRDEYDNFCHYEVGVHIADVSARVKPMTAIDQQAQIRGTTIYCPTRRIDMIPPALSTNLCSLKEKKDRLTFSVIFKIDINGNIISYDIAKSVVNLVQNLSYEDAIIAIDDFDKCTLQIDIKQAIVQLNDLSKKINKSKKKDKLFEDTFLNQSDDSHKLIETYMVMANVAVAKYLYKADPNSTILRYHVGIDQTRYDHAIELIARFSDSEELDALKRFICLTSMKSALYACTKFVEKEEDLFHFGLAEPMYTHFTSPIRRYIDMLVHRLLTWKIYNHSESSKSFTNLQSVEQICRHINDRNKCIRKMDRELEFMNLAFNIHQNPSLQHEKLNGYITSMFRSKLYVYIPKYDIECGLNVMSKRDSNLFIFKCTDENMTIIGKRSKVEFEFNIYDHVIVKIIPNINGLFIKQKLRLIMIKPDMNEFLEINLASIRKPKSEEPVQKERKLKLEQLYLTGGSSCNPFKSSEQFVNRSAIQVPKYTETNISHVEDDQLHQAMERHIGEDGELHFPEESDPIVSRQQNTRGRGQSYRGRGRGSSYRGRGRGSSYRGRGRSQSYRGRGRGRGQSYRGRCQTYRER
jgi:exosome complex exonuclease DIS3/RRP44